MQISAFRTFAFGLYTSVLRDANFQSHVIFKLLFIAEAKTKFGFFDLLFYNLTNWLFAVV